MPNAPKQFRPSHVAKRVGTGKSPATLERCKRYRTKAWEQLRIEVIARDRMTCQLCGKLAIGPKECHVDHIKPVADGGSDELSNLRVLCAACHSRRTATDQKRPRGT